MKRYYHENGEPDEAKTLWVAAKKGLIYLSLFMGLCIIWDAKQEPDPPDKTPHWRNWDSSRSLTEVKSFNYSTGIIEYRGDNPFTPTKTLNIHKKSRGGYNGGIVLQVDGASINLNMDVEDLLDQLTEDADFYEYLERNLD